MATQRLSQYGQPPSEIVVQQSMLEQAQAAAAAQIDPASPTREEALLQTTDLITLNGTEDDLPPPPYGDIYGEIRNEKDGLGTSARVTDDGRVNIHINQLNRRLSQLFTPGLCQHLQSVQDSRPPPPPYIPPSLGGEEGVPPPPSLNVVIQVVGSRGDVQPFVALGKVLKETYGHRVRLATHPNFQRFVEENGLEFFSIGGDPSQLMAFMVKNPGLMPGFRSLMSGDVGKRRRDVAEYIQGCWRSCYQAGDGITTDGFSEPPESGSGSESAARPFVADCIIANPPSFAHIHCAEKLGIPLHIMFTMPYSPTQAFPHPLANITSSNADPQFTNYISYAMIEVLAWQGLGDIINRFRKKCLGLDPVSVIWAPGMLQRLKVPHTYCWSPALISKPEDWGPHISISGFYFLNLASNYTPAPELQAFLDAGPPPVYIGFGSIVLDDPNAMTELIFEAVRKTGQRVLLSKGWGGMGAHELRVPNGVFMLGNVPHDWLFQQVSCVVHHGGAGTTAAGITAGRPTLVVPFFGDQPFWGAMVARAGAGPDPIPHKQLTADNLADAINFCLKPASLERAKELASKIAAERGSNVGAQSFHQHLEMDRLRCTLAPSRAAAWRIKRTQVRLSPFAACTLANANLLDFHDLKLSRAQEYYTDEGPWDPISGGFTAACRAFSSMGMGLAELPSETYKAFVPSESSRPHSQASVQTRAEHNQTSPKPQGSLAQVQNLPAHLSSRSSSSSNIRSNSSRVESNSGKSSDMMRQTGAHTSKGFGRFAKALVQSPMELSVSITKGFHNVPRLYGDDTVRPQQRVSDFRSGVKAAGKEFGYGWYDGITGLFTQPWKGAQTEGTGGLVKGIGKGIGGFVTKPGAAMLGLLGYSMKGVHKEIQQLFGNNVQSYIVTSRVAQGYEEWLQSSHAEKEDVIARWKLIQKYLKKKHSTDEMVRDVLEKQREMAMEDRDARQNGGHTSCSALSTDSADASRQHLENAMPAMYGSQLSLNPAHMDPEELLGAREMDETIRLLVQETSRGDAEEDASTERTIHEDVSQLQRQRQRAEDDQANQRDLLQAIASGEAEAQRHTKEALEYEEELKPVMAQSLREQRTRAGGSEWESEMVLNNKQGEEVEEKSKAIAAKAMATTPTGIQRYPSYDPGHLNGTTQSQFEAQQQGQQREKTTQEKTEEEIVMEYVKKQSLLEAHHQNKGKGRATTIEDDDHDDLQKALASSMQEHKIDEEHQSVIKRR